MILYVFCDTVDFIFGLMDFNLWISCWNWVYFTILLLFFKDWAFTDTYWKFSLSWWKMWWYEFLCEFTFFYHELEININIFAWCDIILFFLLFLFFGLLHFDTSLLSLLLYFFNGFHFLKFVVLYIIIYSGIFYIFKGIFV